MLEVSLRGVSFSYGNGAFQLRDLDMVFRAGAYTAVAGEGATTLLRLISGSLRPLGGEIRIGARVVNGIRESRRPLLRVSHEMESPRRWSVRHALISAVRTRTLDRIDRQREYEYALAKWRLNALAARALSSLSDSEVAQVQLARIDLLHPSLLIADRPLALMTEPLRSWAIDELYRSLRVSGATVISAPSSPAELALADRIVILGNGRVVQLGSPADVYMHPVDEAAASALGPVNAIPVSIHGTTVDSAMGSWEVIAPPFEGSGIALARPDDFTVVAPGEESDFIYGIEEAVFETGRWMTRGILSGGIMLRVALPREVKVHKGKLIALRYEPARFVLVPREMAPPRLSVPTDVIPPMSETR